MAIEKAYKIKFLTWFSQLFTGIVFTGLYYVAPVKTEPVEYAKLVLGLLSTGIGITFFLVPKAKIEKGEITIFQTIFSKKTIRLKDIKTVEFPSEKQDIEINGTLFHLRDIETDDFEDLKKVLKK